MKTKLFSLFLSIIASIGTVFAGGSGSCGENLTWNFTNGTLTISGSGAMANWPSASYVPWYKYRENITNVTIGNSVTSIGENAFNHCIALTSVTIGNSVTSIGDSAFYFCFRMTSVTIPNSVTSIGNYAFEYCTGLTSVTIPNSVMTIGKSAFEDCDSMTSVTIPNSITSIDANAFASCFSLTSVLISDLTAWCGIIFTNASSNPLHYAHHLYLNDTEIKDLIIPNSVTTIGEFAFYGCFGLTSVEIPNSVTSIEWEAFYGCSSLTSVTIPNSITSIDANAFSDCFGLTSVLISDLTAWCRITFTNASSNPLHYAHHLYLNDTEITDLVIPNSITSLGNYTFSGCSGLISVTIPNSVTTIRNSVFAYCTGLTSVTIPNSVTSIERDAFRGCTGLTSVTIGNSVISIGNYAFSDCSGLTRITNYAYTPQSVNSTTFYEVDKSTCFLYVPEQSIALYQVMSGWKEFTNIEAINIEAIDQITNHQSPMIHKVIKDGQLLIQSGDHTYTLTGAEVK